MSSNRNFREVVELVRSRRYLVMGIALSVFLAVVLVSFFLPRKYEASATVRVVDTEALYEVYGRESEALKSAKDLASNFPTRVVSVPNIREVVGRMTAEGGVSPGSGDVDTLAEKIRDGTFVEPVPGKEGEVRYRIVHRSDDPSRAQSIVTHLATVPCRGMNASKRQEAAGTLAEVRETLAEKEQAHKSAAAELETFETENAHHGLGKPDDTQARLVREKKDLEKARAEITGLDEQLKSVREQLSEETEFVVNEDGSEQVANEVWAELKSTERAVISELTVKQRIRDELEGRVEALTKKAKEFPAIEARWNALVKAEADLGTTVASLREREVEVRVDWQKTAAESAVVMDVVDAPEFPKTAYGNDRLLVSVLGLVLGLCFGLATVLILGFMDCAFRRSEEVAVLLDAPVLGAIARIETLAERVFAKRKRRSALVAVLVLFLLAGAGLTAQILFDAQISALVRESIGFIK